MKNIFIYIGALILLLNSLAGSILSSYNSFNWIANDVIIFANTILLGILSYSKFKDGFKISFSFLLPVLGLTQLIFGFFLSENLVNNIPIIFIAALFVIQLSFLLIGKVFSKYI